VNPRVARKVPAARAFLDFSDYAGPAVRWLVARLIDSPIVPVQLTLAFTVSGLGAGALFALGRLPWLAAALLLLTGALDAADGSLARARGRPSRVGRFLDSDCDFIVNLAVFGGIAAGAVIHGGPAANLGLGLAALVSAMLQVSLYNHYYVVYRTQTGGDQTSRANEDQSAAYPWDNPAWLGPLFLAYRLIYGWQDAWVTRLDRLATPDGPLLTPTFMTAVSALGLGTQLLVIAVCAAFGRPLLALWLFVTAFNGYAIILLLLRRRQR
jgi:phosphatidylglycerophosphate synthase